MANKIQVRRGTKAQLAALGPLAVGEPGYTTDTHELVVGNGTGANTPIVTSTSADITYYVRTDGSDTNTGLANTASGAFKTWAKVNSMIPSDVNHIVLVYVAPGSYAEPLIIKGRSGGGYIHVIGGGTTAAAAGYIFQSVDIEFNDLVIGVDGFTFTNTGGAAVISAYNSKQVMIALSRVVAASSFGAFYFYSCPVGVVMNCEISNRARAIESSSNSKVVAQNNTGTGNAVGLYAADGGEIRQAGTFSAATTPTMTPNGGSIMYDSGVVGPWGDNTLTSRSAVRTYINTSHTLTNGTFTKLQFNAVSQDYLQEFNTTNYRFTAKKTGWYLVEGSLNTGASYPQGYTLVLSAFLNGSRELDLGSYTRSGAAGFIYTQGSRVIYLPAGSYLELFAFADGGNMVTPAGSAIFTSFCITQIA